MNERFFVGLTTIEYIKWKDAYYIAGDCNPEELKGLCEIESLGWLVREDEDYVYLVMEKPAPGDDGIRNPFGILKVNIIERRTFSILPRRGGKKSTAPVVSTT